VLVVVLMTADQLIQMYNLSLLLEYTSKFTIYMQSDAAEKATHASSSRNESTSKRAVYYSSRPPSSSGVDPNDATRSTTRMMSSSTSRPSSIQRLHHSGGVEARASPLSRATVPSRGPAPREDSSALRNFELLSISAERRK
jgi:hypothetical protein